MMQTNVYETSRSGRTAAGPDVLVQPGIHRRLSWGAVIAGVVLVLATHLLLSLLGVGVGFTTIDPAQQGGTPQASTLGIGAGVWWTISYMIALMLGGYVAARLSGVLVRGNGVLHGLVTWAAALLLSAWLLTSTLGSVLGTTFNAIGSVASGVGQTVQQAVPEVAQAAGLSADQLRQRAEELLRPADQGPQSREAALRDLARNVTAIATGGEGAEQARQQAVSIISQQAGIPEDQANQRLAQLEEELRQTGQQAAETATQAADTASTTLASAGIGTFISLLLGAIAAMVGGALGTRKPDRVATAH
jgi:hypothetical protein